MPPKNPTAGKESLTTAADFIKYTTAFATGALVFSAGLLDKTLHISTFTVVVLIAAWVFLTISSVAGVLVFARIPIMQSEENYDLEDKYFTGAGKVHQVLFIIGILALGSVLVVILSTTHIGKREFKVASALQATLIAKQHIPKGSSVLRLEKAELQPGVGDPEKALPVWLITLSVQHIPTPKDLQKTARDSSATSTTPVIAAPTPVTRTASPATGAMPATCTKNCRYHCTCVKIPAPPVNSTDTVNILIDAFTGQVLSIP